MMLVSTGFKWFHTTYLYKFAMLGLLLDRLDHKLERKNLLRVLNSSVKLWEGGSLFSKTLIPRFLVQFEKLCNRSQVM